MKVWSLSVGFIFAAGAGMAQVPDTATRHATNAEISKLPVAAAAPTDTSPRSTTFRSSVDLVALNVVVTDTKQKFVTGLSAENFAVFEDGVRQDVAFFAAGMVPLDLAILLDTSASMADKIQTAQHAAVGFASSLSDDDRLLVVDIKDGSRVLSPLSSDIQAASAAIRGTVPSGGTALYNGLYLTLKELTKSRQAASDVRRQAIVVLSDGDDTASLVGFDDVMELAKRSGIAIYTITLRSKWMTRQTAAGNSRYFSQSEYGMRSLAQETGGRPFFPQDISELAGVYGTIAEELATQYSIAFTSKNPKKDGAYRRLIVRIVDGDETPGAAPGGGSLAVRTRTGYLAAAARP